MVVLRLPSVVGPRAVVVLVNNATVVTPIEALPLEVSAVADLDMDPEVALLVSDSVVVPFVLFSVVGPRSVAWPLETFAVMSYELVSGLGPIVVVALLDEARTVPVFEAVLIEASVVFTFELAAVEVVFLGIDSVVTVSVAILLVLGTSVVVAFAIGFIGAPVVVEILL